MLIISTFEHTLEVEQALAVVEKLGINREHIMAVPMERFDADPSHLIFRAENVKATAFEVGIAAATATCVIGCSAGFKLKWGPIAWGIIAAMLGFAIGFNIVWFLRMRKGAYRAARSPRTPMPEITVIIDCDDAKISDVRRVLWSYRAISVGQL